MTPAAAAAFAAALFCVALMGYAIQRGATCTVAAVDEWVAKRSARRLLGMAEAALWVAGGLLVAAALHALPAMPAGYAITGWTVAGGVLLGLGAWVNGACVFGAIARLGSGEWAYAATPIGYLAGCATVQALFAPAPPQVSAATSLLFEAAQPLAVAFVLFALWRLVPPLVRLDPAALRARVWQPHAATTVIGITFFFTLLLAGAWAYTDLLADLARGMPERVAPRLALFAALLAGAAWGGYTAGRWQPRWPAPRQVALCLAGGALMGYGTLLIPGSNDGLILVGMPLLRPYAWLAFGTMCLTIALAQLARRRWPAGMSNFHHGSATGGGAA
ncbi:MAG: YeeE/YedE family protein [Rubrivivax sp.]|nr:YeeE/YedE family protein [Rubrivivax sp.]